MSGRSTVLAALLCLGSLAVTACGGTGGGAGTTTAAHVRPPYTPCDNPAEVRLAPTVCWSPVGSHWRLVAQAPGGEYTFDIELMAGGRVRSTDVTGATPATDEWFVENDVVRIFLQNRYVEYRGTLHNGTVLVGEATNVRGDVWTFRADRRHDGARCPANELVATDGEEPGCFAIAGSRWTVHAGPNEYEVEFGADGHLVSTNAADTTPDDDGWEQQGGTVRFWFDNHATELTASVAPSSLERLSGNGHDASGGSFAFTAEAIPSYPPPIH
jgi:hypothetical protein